MDTQDSTDWGGIRYVWLGQSTVRMTLEDGFTIYTDPVMLDEDPARAGLILITHHHVDHCLPEFITPIRDEATKIAAYHESYLKYCVHDIKGVRTIKIGQTIELGPARVTGIEAYTKRGFHAKGEGCGFLIEVAGQRIYFSGDSAATDEMRSLKGIDVAIISIADNTYTIDAGEVLNAVKEMKPRLFIPVHYTPFDEPEPSITGELYLSKDPRFYTKKEDPSRFAATLEGTGIELCVLKKKGAWVKGGGK